MVDLAHDFDEFFGSLIVHGVEFLLVGACAATLAARLEALKGDRRGCFSIRINDQWRLVFRWDDGHAYDVAIVDYH